MYFTLINIHVLCSYYIKTLFASYAVILNDTSDAASVKVNSEFVFLWGSIPWIGVDPMERGWILQWSKFCYVGKFNFSPTDSVVLYLGEE